MWITTYECEHKKNLLTACCASIIMLGAGTTKMQQSQGKEDAGDENSYMAKTQTG